MLPLADGALSGLLTGVGAVLLALRLRPSAARWAWSLLLAIGVAHAIGSSTSERNLVNINVVHHYLGAKYSVRYADFYRAVDAALERPQVAMRDLEHPPAMWREDPREQRAYFIELLRERGLEFDATAATEELERRATESGAIRDEAARILEQLVGAEHAGSFRDDVRAAAAAMHWERDITTDYGFNGSPFYVLVRRLDPTLHRPFSSATAHFNVALQILAILAVAWITGAALDLEVEQRIAAAALLFASWDFVGYALAGLVCAGLWLPVSIALLAVRRRAFGCAGVAIAWAGAIKLFPFVLALPFALRLAREIVSRRRLDRNALKALGACAAASALFAAVGAASESSWSDFAEKISAQFLSRAVLMNSVSASAGLLALGGHGALSPVPGVLALAVLVVAAAMFLRDDSEWLDALPRRMLVLLALGPWVSGVWLNYYALPALLLLPVHATARRASTALCALSMAAAFALPEFDDAHLLDEPWIHALKVAPYLVLPGWWLWIELSPSLVSLRARRVALALAALGALAITGEAARLRAIRRSDRLGQQCLDRGETAAALAHFQELLRLDPGNAAARMNEAIAFAGAGREAEAARSFARAAALEPRSAFVRQNNGRWMLHERKPESALVELEAAHALAPFDDSILVDLARAHLSLEHRARAAELLGRARELRPENEAATSMLRQL